MTAPTSSSSVGPKPIPTRSRGPWPLGHPSRQRASIRSRISSSRPLGGRVGPLSWSTSFRQRRVRQVPVGQDRPAVGRPGHVRPRHADGGVVPGEAQLVRAVVLVGDEVQQLERLEARKPCATPVGITTHSSASARGSRAARCRAATTGRTSTSATKARPLGPPSSRAGGGDSGGRGARRRRNREVGLDESRRPARPSCRASAADVGCSARARGRSPGCPRSGRRTVARPTPRRSSVTAPTRPSAARRSSAGSRRAAPPCQRRIGSPDGSGVGSRTPRRAASKRRLQVDVGTSSTSTSTRGHANRRAPSRPARRGLPFTRWWMPAISPEPSRSTMASATSAV